MPAGDAPEPEAGTELIHFNPADELAATVAAIEKSRPENQGV